MGKAFNACAGSRRGTSYFNTLKLLVLALSLGACQSSDRTEASLAALSSPIERDRPTSRGMLIVGDGPVYLSALPTHHKAHDYQLVLEVDFVKTGSDPVATYAEDRRVTGEPIYTVVPEAFVLPELFTPAQGPQRRSFRASIFRGHFERNGAELIKGVTVTVKRVVLAKRIEAEPLMPQNLRYLLFGNDKELFAAHVIKGTPDFEQVVAVRIAEGVATAAQAAVIRTGTTVDFGQVGIGSEQALKEGQDYRGVAQVGGEALPLHMKVLTDYYLETSELPR